MAAEALITPGMQVVTDFPALSHFLMKESSDTDWCLSYLLMNAARIHNRHLHFIIYRLKLVVVKQKLRCYE